MQRVPTWRSLLARMLCVPAIGVSALLVTGCAPLTSQRPASEPSLILVQGVKDVSISDARALSEQGVTVIDVREPHEFRDGHVPGARNLPLGQLDHWAQDLSPEGAYVIICRSGKRSAKATQELEAKGFQHLRNVTGGMLSWEKENFPISK